MRHTYGSGVTENGERWERGVGWGRNGKIAGVYKVYKAQKVALFIFTSPEKKTIFHTAALMFSYYICVIYK